MFPENHHPSILVPSTMTGASSLTEQTIGDSPVGHVEKIDEIPAELSLSNTQLRTHDFGIIPIPSHLRYDPSKSFHFGLILNIIFGFFSTFSELTSDQNNLNH